MLTFVKIHLYLMCKLYPDICKDEIESPLHYWSPLNYDTNKGKGTPLHIVFSVTYQFSLC
jgi:hypothetical protein